MASPSNLAKGPVPLYVVDPARSRFQVKASAAGLLSSFGHNPTVGIRDFSGDCRFQPENPEQSFLRIRIQAGSLEITGDINEKDRSEMDRTMKRDVLETDRYPEIRFEGSGAAANKITDGMFRITLAGRLSLHGIEKELQFPCNVTVSDDSLRANGEFSIRQTDFHIKLVSVAGGALKLKDELKFMFDILAYRKREVGNE